MCSSDLLDLYGCQQLKELKIEKEGKVQSNLISDSEASSSGYLSEASTGYADDTRSRSAIDGVVHIPLNLKKIRIDQCPHLIFDGSMEGQKNGRCLLPQSLEHLDWFDYPRKALRPYFVGNLTCLKKLNVRSESLECLQMDSCTALEELEIRLCEQLVALEGMQSLGTLRSLALCGSSRLNSL